MIVHHHFELVGSGSIHLSAEIKVDEITNIFNGARKNRNNSIVWISLQDVMWLKLYHSDNYLLNIININECN